MLCRHQRIFGASALAARRHGVCGRRGDGGRGRSLGSTRWILILLAVVGLILQGQLWLDHDGYRKTRTLRHAVQDQRQRNATLRARNSALDAEVLNLKRGLDAAEERARTDLGLIGRRETFYQVVPVAADSD